MSLWLIALGNQKEITYVRKISSPQMDEKRKKGLYFHCDEKCGPDHVCEKPKLYLMQVDESIGEEQVQEAAVIIKLSRK